MANNPETAPKSAATTDAGWRYKLGMAMFILPVISMAVTPVIVPLLGLSAGDTAALIGSIILGGEVVWFASIPLLGKEGFKRVKSQLFSKFKLTDKPISQGRHRLGMCLSGGALAFQLLVLVWIVGGFFYLGSDHLTEGVAGVTFAEEATSAVYALIASAMAFFVGIWVLGARLISRLSDALVWREEA